MLACATLTCRARAVFAVAAVLLLVGLGGGRVDAAPFTVPNPYASGLGDTDISIRRAVVFGDSYSKNKRKSWHNWAEQLRYDLINPASSKTLITALPAYAVSGATAGTYLGSTNDFTHQVTRWLGTSPKFIARDLTVVYLGYNDIKLSLDRAATTWPDAMLAYGRNWNGSSKPGPPVARGASSWSCRTIGAVARAISAAPRPPSCARAPRSGTHIWRGSRATRPTPASWRWISSPLWNASYKQPADFGFTNVTSTRPQGGDPAKYLYDLNDDIHFGHRGQSLIRQVVQYYLTRGWDWSNTYKDPGTARQKLITDLADGKVFDGISCDPPSTAVAAAG